MHDTWRGPVLCLEYRHWNQSLILHLDLGSWRVLGKLPKWLLGHHAWRFARFDVVNSGWGSKCNLPRVVTGTQAKLVLQYFIVVMMTRGKRDIKGSQTVKKVLCRSYMAFVWLGAGSAKLMNLGIFLWHPAWRDESKVSFTSNVLWGVQGISEW